MPLIISYYYYYFRGNIIYFATSASGHRHCRAMGPILTREHLVILSGLSTYKFIMITTNQIPNEKKMSFPWESVTRNKKQL